MCLHAERAPFSGALVSGGMPVSAVLRRLSSWPFTVVGIVTLTLWLLAVSGVFYPTGAAFQVLIIPVHLMQTLVVALEVLFWGPHVPRAVDRAVDIITMPLLLAPYVLLDLLISRLRDRMIRRRSAPPNG